jgi:hypothetical protein
MNLNIFHHNRNKLRTKVTTVNNCIGREVILRAVLKTAEFINSISI